MKRLLYFFVIIAFALSGCEREEMPVYPDVPEGFMPINIAFSAPDMISMETKAVDPDGKGINSITLFCFDNFGMFIHYVDNVQIEKAQTGISLTGVITETSVPENTRRIHFVANQNMSTFNVDDFRGLSEYDVAAKLEGSSGMMIYWGYFAADDSYVNDSEDFQDALKAAHGVVKGNDGKWVAVKDAKPIRMLRNQARFMVNTGSSGFQKTGFTVVNTNAFGTVAPYHPEKGFKFSMVTTNSQGTEVWGSCDWTNDVFLTLPHNTTRLSPPEDVDKADETCVFETDNNSAHPVSIIIKGKNNGETQEKYYRVILMKNDEYVKVRRNFNYNINIVGKLHYGQDTFEAALTAPATNNIWLSIDDDVKEVTDNTYSLSVKETDIVVLAENNGTVESPNWVLSKPANGKEFDLIGNQLDLGYNLVRINGGSVTESDAPQASWVEGSMISKTEVINKFFDREVSVYLDNLDGLLTSPQIEGTILLKKGVLQRKIKVIVLNKMSFSPVWVSTQVNMDANSNVNLLFTVPESCPDELLPFKVYVSVNHLDIRVSSGRTFPVITPFTDPDNYGADTYSSYKDDGSGEGNPIGYKYVYTVTQKGDQRMYFSNTVDRSETLGNLTEWVTLESAYFETVKKPFTFNTSGDFRIEMPGLKIFDPTTATDGNGSGNGNTSQFSPDEQIKYMLVPQKVNAPVTLDLAFTQWDDSNSDGTKDISVLDDDEFLFYSENLMHLYGHDDNQTCNCTFKYLTGDLDINNTGGTLHAFKFDEASKYKKKIFNEKERIIYEILAKTKKAKSEEVVRISSNPGPKYAFSASQNPPARQSYRSIIFELANYRPFRFAAQISVGGSTAVGEKKDNNIIDRNAAEQLETIDQISISYAPEQNVDIYLDITSFKGTDGASVDPFGTAFYVYIKAPMLDLPSTLSDNQKAKLIEVDNGVFAYLVDADRETEGNSPFKYSNAINDDLTDGEGTAATNGIDQNGERKKLTFVKGSIVADGEILITTDPVEAGVSGISGHETQIVNYYSKKFKVSSQKITGTIQKKDTENGVASNLDADAFVSFALTRNNSRIGSMVIHAADAAHNNMTWYELTLRPEYSFNWNDDNPGNDVADIIVSHTHEKNSTYEVFTANVRSLASLLESPNITLVKQDIQ